MSIESRYCTCPHLTKDLILHAITLSQNFSRSTNTWFCCHCNEIFTNFKQLNEHYLLNDSNHFLYLYRRTARNELYCINCQDYQYSHLFDQFTSLCQPKLKNHRVIGFINMGSTCFLSSILQILLSNPILIRFFDLSELFIHNCKALSSQSTQLCLFCELSKLFKIVNKYTWRTDGTEIASTVPSEVLCAIWTSSRHLAHYEQHDAHELLIALLDTLGSHLQFNHGDHNLIQLLPHGPPIKEDTKPILQTQGVCHSPRSWSEEIKDSTHEVSHSLHTDSIPPEENSEEEKNTIRPSSIVPSLPQESTIGLNYIFRGIVNETFSGVLRSELTCHTCSHRRSKYEPFVDLSLSIGKKGLEISVKDENDGHATAAGSTTTTAPSTTTETHLPDDEGSTSNNGRTKSREKKKKGSKPGVTLVDCLSGFTSLEHLQHSVECENCGVSGSSSKKLTIHVPPNCLIIHLKRFSGMDGDPLASQTKPWEDSQGECGKIDTPVNFPINGLNILPFISPELHPVRHISIPDSSPQPEVPAEDSMEIVPSTETPVTMKSRRGRKKKISPTIKTDLDAAFPSSLLYDLFGVVSHKGESLSQGHYISYVRSEGICASKISTESQKGSHETPLKRRRSFDFHEGLDSPPPPPVDSEKPRGRGRPRTHTATPTKSSDHQLPPPKNAWIKCDDEFITPVESSEVESIEGYILIYIRRDVSEKLFV